MSIISVAPVTAGTLILASKYNADIAAILAGINGNLDRNNISTQWQVFTIHRRFALDTGTSSPAAVYIPLPVTANMTNVRFIGMGFSKPTTTNNRVLTAERYTLATRTFADTIKTTTITGATQENYIDATVTAIVPGTYGIRLEYAVTTSTFEANEYLDVDIWLAAQIAAVTEV